jgi:two-component system response regulator FlrC
VRELHNVMQRALILKSGLTINAGSILFEPAISTAPLIASSPTPVSEPSCDDDEPLADGLKSREMDLIIQTLSAQNGSRKETAARLGISPRTLRYKLARFREQGVAIPTMAHLVQA